MIPPARDHKKFLREELSDPEKAASYVDAMLQDEEGGPNEMTRALFMMALRDVAGAHGVAKVASSAGINRESLYRALTSRGNPRLSSLLSLLKAIGLRLAVASRKTATWTLEAAISGQQSLKVEGSESHGKVLSFVSRIVTTDLESTTISSGSSQTIEVEVRDANKPAAA